MRSKLAGTSTPDHHPVHSLAEKRRHHLTREGVEEAVHPRY